MATPDKAEIESARRTIISLITQEYENHSLDKLDPYEFGNAVAPLVNAFAALTIVEKDRDQAAGLGSASRSDD